MVTCCVSTNQKAGKGNYWMGQRGFGFLVPEILRLEYEIFFWIFIANVHVYEGSRRFAEEKLFWLHPPFKSNGAVWSRLDVKRLFFLCMGIAYSRERESCCCWNCGSVALSFFQRSFPWNVTVFSLSMNCNTVLEQIVSTLSMKMDVGCRHWKATLLWK